jgi:GNAT superfamily N-acetyltransferase
MDLTNRSFQEGDYETFVQALTKSHMQQYFVEFFGGWSDDVSKKRFFKCVEQGSVQLFFLNDSFVGYFAELTNVLEDLHVVDSFQGKGIGSQILQHALLQKDLEVLVFATNPALAFYERNNFIKKSFDEAAQTFRLQRKI